VRDLLGRVARAEGGACFEILLPATREADQPQAEAA
jgi:hypothetical protein